MVKTVSSIFNSDPADAAQARLFACRALFAVPLAVLVVAVNVAVDPAHTIRRRAYSAAIGRALAQGKGVVGASDFDERLMQKAYVEASDLPDDVVILGSSRAMQIGARELGLDGSDIRVHNASVSSASLDDLIALYGLYRARGRVPRQVILSLDPWMFNSHVEFVDYLSLSDSYLATARALSPMSPQRRLRVRWNAGQAAFDRLSQAVSPSYFQAALDALRRRKPLRFRVVEGASSDDDGVIRPDGTRLYPLEDRSRGAPEVERFAIQFGKTRPVYNLNGFDRPDPALSAKLEAFLALMTRDGAGVSIFLPPYHPAAWTEMRRGGIDEKVASVEALVRRLAGEKDLVVLGGYASAPPDSSFFDGLHPRAETIGAMLSKADFNLRLRSGLLQSRL